MNSKVFLLPLALLVLFLITACGLKRPPAPPKGSALPSIPEGYMYQPKQSVKEEADKQKKPDAAVKKESN